MKFFNRFPKVDYTFGSLNRTNEYTNLSVYVDIIDQIKDDATTYQLYSVRDGERPDIVSDKLYGSSVYGWTFFILNDHIREQGWPLSYQDFREYLSSILPGVCFETSGTTTNATTGITQLAMTNQFPVGSNVVGSISGATGVVYNRNTNLGQIFCTKTSVVDFINGETIVDNLSSPTYSLNTDSVSLAYEAVHHYEDGDGIILDIDPTTGLNPSSYTPVTYEEYLEEQNDNLGNIKVLRPALIARFASLYKEALDR